MKKLTCFCPPETVRALPDPDRGMYPILRHMLSEGPDGQDPRTDIVSWDAETLAAAVSWDPEAVLVLLEISLKRYRSGPIPAPALERLDALFDTLRPTGKRLIVRFLYDWDGKNMETEPQRIQTVLGHMRQTGEAIRRHEDQIFTLQGLFIGNWGEMNATRYRTDDELRRLAGCLAEAAGPRVLLAVRTPGQLRRITADPALAGISGRLGLFNDGMLSNGTDMGTFAASGPGPDPQGRLPREEELRFLDGLCRRVPYGGEAVGTSVHSLFPRALETLRAAHVTYLGRDYDPQTLERWRAHTVESRDVWNGTDGLTYIRRRLGYRFVLREVKLSRELLRRRLRFTVRLANIGFAPPYRPLEAELVLDAAGRTRVLPLPGDLRAAADGAELVLRAGLPAEDLPSDGCDIRFRLRGADGTVVLPANAGDGGEDARGTPDTNGILIGRSSTS